MDKQLAENIGAAAKAARVRAALTQADVAERLGIATEVYGRLERGLMLPSVTTLRKLSRTLTVPTDVMLGLDTVDATEAASPLPESGEHPDLRRLMWRAAALPPRQLRLLNMLARTLAPRGEEATPAQDALPAGASDLSGRPGEVTS